MRFSVSTVVSSSVKVIFTIPRHTTIPPGVGRYFEFFADRALG